MRQRLRKKFLADLKWEDLFDGPQPKFEVQQAKKKPSPSTSKSTISPNEPCIDLTDEDQLIKEAKKQKKLEKEAKKKSKKAKKEIKEAEEKIKEGRMSFVIICVKDAMWYLYYAIHLGPKQGLSRVCLISEMLQIGPHLC